MFEGAVGEQCVIIRVTDGDTTNIVNRSYNLTLESTREVSSVPVLIYPSTVSILVIDDDIQGNHTSTAGGGGGGGSIMQIYYYN